MFARLTRWLVVSMFVFSVTGNVSADRVTIPELLDEGYKIVSSVGDSNGMNVLLMNRKTVYLCYLHRMQGNLHDFCRQVY